MANKKFNSWIKNICMGWGFIKSLQPASKLQRLDARRPASL